MIEHDDATSPESIVDALEAAYGVNPGERRNHAKGTCAIGTFVGSNGAARYSRSALFSGEPVPVVARFSVSGGNPDAADVERSVRGMALEFRLPDGNLHHMTMINTPTFFAAVPRTFLDKFLAMKPDPATGKPDPKRLEAFAATHADNRGQAQFLADHNPPASYTHETYFGIHTFRFRDRANQVTLVKWRFVPRDGEKRLADAEMTSMPRDFLEQALIERSRQGPVCWDMVLTLGEPGDPETDPSIPWPAERSEVLGGSLVLTSAMNAKGAACDRVVYDPLVMADGIEATADPVLLFRSPAYGLSASKRLQGR